MSPASVSFERRKAKRLPCNKRRPPCNEPSVCVCVCACPVLIRRTGCFPASKHHPSKADFLKVRPTNNVQTHLTGRYSRMPLETSGLPMEILEHARGVVPAMNIQITPSRQSGAPFVSQGRCKDTSGVPRLEILLKWSREVDHTPTNRQNVCVFGRTLRERGKLWRDPSTWLFSFHLGFHFQSHPGTGPKPAGLVAVHRTIHGTSHEVEGPLLSEAPRRIQRQPRNALRP